MKTFDVLNRDLNVFAPHFLEASAGTGKTFAIEHLVVRLLIEKEKALTIDQILVVTFTKAAARELKLRIRRCLWKAKEELTLNLETAVSRLPPPTVDYLKALCEKGEEVIKNALSRIEAALICYDAAQIYTLHGFCHRILKEFAFEAGIGLEVSDPEEKEHLVLLEEVVKDHLKESVVFPDYSPLQIQIVLNKYRGDIKKLISKLVDSVSLGKEILPSLNFQELLNLFLQQIQSMPCINTVLFKEDVERLRPIYKEMTGDEISSQVQWIAEILESKRCTHQQFDQLLKGDFFLEKMHLKNIKVRAKIPESHTLHYPHLIDKLRSSILPLIEKGKDPSQIFLRLARDCQEKCHYILESLEKFSPDALLIRVETALNRPDFVQCVRQKYRAAIIDEFQDTDPIQWNIFQQLFLNLETAVSGLTSMDAVCLVGDPKQSIYSFRNADVYTYLAAAEAMGPSAKKYLDTNFRSTPSLVEGLNLLFAKAGKGWMALPERGEPLDVMSVKAGIQGDRGNGNSLDNSEAAVQFFIAVGKKGRAKKFPTPEILENTVFPFIASVILASDAQYQKIAILVKDRFQAQQIVTYLKDRGIPASSKRGAAITESVAYFALKELLLAVCSPYDMSRVKAALGGPFISWNIEQLSQGLSDPSLLQAKVQMQRLNHTLLEEGFGPFLQAFLSEREFCNSFDRGNYKTSGSCKIDDFESGCNPAVEDILEKVAETAGLQPDSKGRFCKGREFCNSLDIYLDLRKLAELLIEEEMKRGLKGEDFLLFLDEIAIEAQRETGRLKVPSQEEKGSITVMTMHMSKGLEFDTVFALGLASRHKIADTITIKKQDSSDISRVTMVLDAKDLACQLAIEELDAEKMRQLYVALTRAKRKLYIPLIIDEEQKPIDLGEASAMELFFARVVEPTSSSHPALYAIAQRLNLNQVKETLDTLSPQISYQILKSQDLKFVAPEKPLLESLIMPLEPFNFPCFEQQLFSFTALAKKDHAKACVNLPSPAAVSRFKSPMDDSLSPHTLPLGSETGHILHLIFEKIFKRRIHNPLDESALSFLIEEEIALTPLEKWRPILLPWIVALLKKRLTTFALVDLPAHQFQQEMEFFFPLPNGMILETVVRDGKVRQGFGPESFKSGGSHSQLVKGPPLLNDSGPKDCVNLPSPTAVSRMMKGFADLFFEFEGKYYLLDWKSNYLGPSDADYSQENIIQVMHQNDYFLQASIYREALSRYVKLFDNRPFSECFGGAIYYFIRGNAVYHFEPFPEIFIPGRIAAIGAV